MFWEKKHFARDHIADALANKCKHGIRDTQTKQFTLREFLLWYNNPSDHEGSMCMPVLLIASLSRYHPLASISWVS
jgi:hypothetical protein